MDGREGWGVGGSMGVDAHAATSRQTPMLISIVHWLSSITDPHLGALHCSHVSARP